MNKIDTARLELPEERARELTMDELDVVAGATAAKLFLKCCPGKHMAEVSLSPLGGTA